MSDYSYSNGQGVDQLSSSTPVGGAEPMSALDDAIRQIKMFLKDPTAGFKYVITQVESLKSSAANNTLPTGMVSAYAGTSAPSGWLLCDGSAVSRSTYASLFSAVGITYGAGDSVTTFNLPDLKGRSIFMNDGGAGRITQQGVNKSGGEENHTLTLNEIPSHNHAPIGIHYGDAFTGGGTSVAVGRGNDMTLNTGIITATSNGGGLSHNNMPPYLTLNYIIKV